MDRKPARQTGVRFSTCTFVQVKPRQALRFRLPSDVERTNAPRRSYLATILHRLRDTVPLAARQEIADQRVTASDRLVLDRSFFKPHRTQCSSILAIFTPRFRAVQHPICGKLVITFASQNAGAEGSAPRSAVTAIGAGTSWYALDDPLPATP